MFEKTKVSQTAVSETIVFTMFGFRKHRASTVKTYLLGLIFPAKNLNTNP